MGLVSGGKIHLYKLSEGQNAQEHFPVDNQSIYILPDNKMLSW